MSLTVKEIDAIKPTHKEVRHHDGDGLYLCVQPTGSKLWRVRYYFMSKESMISVGKYPVVTLREARDRCAEVRKMVESGLNPATEKKRKKQAAEVTSGTFEFFARKWMESRPWSRKHYDKNLLRMEKNVFPYFKGRDIASITEDEFREVFDVMKKRGVMETRHRVCALSWSVYKYARKFIKGLDNPIEDIKDDIPKPKAKNYATILHPDEIGDLLLKIETYAVRGTIEVSTALRLAPYVLLRPVNICEAEWSEINFKTAEWCIPADKMKMSKDHIVPLSTQAIELFRYMHKFSGEKQYVFPGRRRADVKTISVEAVLKAIRNIGYKSGEFTTHGFRHMGSTLLNEMDYRREWIELQLAHEEKNAVVRAYNHAQYLPARRKMMQDWADYLDSLREEARTR